jgi:hypothetical protein
MSSTTSHTPVPFFGRRIYILFTAIAAVPVWTASNAYVHTIGVHEDEAVASAITICFIAGIFAGRYIAQIWTLHMNVMPRRMIVALAAIVAVCIGWLFFHADFPLRDRVAVNLLLFWLPFVLMTLCLGMLIKTIRAVTEKQLREAQTSAVRSETELRLLQSQLSPHFLFNTLNNMYGLSITQHEKVPPLLLKLSELLRYSVYGSNEMFVPLREEMVYIRNYIEFEKIRLGDRLGLKSDIEFSLNDDISVAPMLLIVFIENAFKHARNTADDKVFIEISLKTWNNLILFSVKNSYSKKEKTEFDKNSGFGLDNVKKRLELLYPEEHKLDIIEEADIYTVMLQVKIKK